MSHEILNKIAHLHINLKQPQTLHTPDGELHSTGAQDVEEDGSRADTQDVNVAEDVEEDDWERTIGATLKETTSSD